MAIVAATAGHCLEFLVRELDASSERRSAREHQVDGLRGLLNRPYLNALRESRP